MEVPIFENYSDFVDHYEHLSDDDKIIFLEKSERVYLDLKKYILNKPNREKRKFLCENSTDAWRFLTADKFLIHSSRFENNVSEILQFIKENISTIPQTQARKMVTYNFTDEVLKLGDYLFNADRAKLELLQYLSDNFNPKIPRFTELTKYNQIFFYLDLPQQTPRQPYKDLIKLMFGFEYGKSDIKGETERHQITLSNLEKNFSKL